jgi:hypothetical protein
LAKFYGTLVIWGSSSFQFFPRISTFFGLNITEETLLVEMRIWCIKIGVVLVLPLINGVSE